MSILLGGTKIYTVYTPTGPLPFTPVETLITGPFAPNTFSHTIPVGCAYVDVVAFGGGGGGANSVPGRDGKGGQSGRWAATTLVVGKDIAPGGTITGQIGAGGRGGELGNLTPGGGNLTQMISPVSFQAAQGAGGANNVRGGESQGVIYFNGRGYAGGPGGSTGGADGGPGGIPGGGGAGGKAAPVSNPGGNGASGGVYIYCYGGQAASEMRIAEAVYFQGERVWPEPRNVLTGFGSNTTAGSSIPWTFTVPARAIEIDVLGLGGGGGGGGGQTAASGNGGGAAQGWVAVTAIVGKDCQVGDVISLTVGSGGGGGATVGNVAGGSGVNTVITIPGFGAWAAGGGYASGSGNRPNGATAPSINYRGYVYNGGGGAGNGGGAGGTGGIPGGGGGGGNGGISARRGGDGGGGFGYVRVYY